MVGREAHPVEVGHAAVAQVAAHGRQQLFVKHHEQVDGALADLQRGHVRQKVVAHEEAHEHKVVEQALLVQLERQRCLWTSHPGGVRRWSGPCTASIAKDVESHSHTSGQGKPDQLTP